MKVQFYNNFSKRPNSSKIPSTPYDVELELLLKEDTSIEQPAFVLNGNIFTYNYAYIPAWNRYYFVGEAVSIANGLTQLTLHEDYLASHKSAVGSTKAMILRSSTGYNVWIPDEEVYVSTQKTEVRTVDDVHVGFAKTPGCYLLSVSDNFSYSNGGKCRP